MIPKDESMSARELCDLIKERHACGQYVYVRIKDKRNRIINARTRKGAVQVEQLITGEWSDLGDGEVFAQ